MSWCVALAALAAAVAAVPASAQERPRVQAMPYVEVGQALLADLDGGDVLTYTTVAAGVDAAVTTRRVSAQIGYRYEHNFSWDRRVGDTDAHYGLARVDARVAPGLTLTAGGLATRTRADIRGAAPGVIVGDAANVSQVYAVYGGPAYARSVGPVGLSANYQVGYTKVTVPGLGGIAAGQPRLDYYDDSVGQAATASIGVAPHRVAPIGLTATAGWQREDAGQLRGRFEAWRVRGDALAPVSMTVALTAGVGYEKIRIAQADVLRDAQGAPVADAAGRFVSAPGPRRIAYRTAGIYYDAGVVWRPNRRAQAEVHVGERYGSLSVTGAASYQGAHSAAALTVYDTVTTFGQQLRAGLNGLPTSFVAARDAFTQRYNGCVFGTEAAGGCLTSALQSISTASYRARGGDLVLSTTRGLRTLGIGMGYANRRLNAPGDLPSGIVVSGLDDESYYGQAFYRQVLTPRSSFDANLFVNYYDPGFAAAADVWSYGGTASYNRQWGRLSGNATVGVYSFTTGDADALWSAQALLAARYSF